MNDLLKLLGRSPSTVLRDDPAAEPFRATGYEVTDFAGMFTVAKARFLVTSGVQSPVHAIADKIRIESAGTLPVPSGKMAVFDPCDHAYFDRSILSVSTPLPRADHHVFFAHQDHELMTVVVVFAGDREVVGWLPALLGDPAPMPTPPRFPMPAIRFSLGLGDAELMQEVLGRVLVELDVAEQEAIMTALGDGARRDPRPVLVPDGKDPSIEHLRSAFARSRTKGVASHGGLVAFRCGERPTSWLGLDGAGEPRALAFDFAGLRRWHSPLVSAPGLLLELDSLSERFRAAGYATGDTPELARSFLARIKACGRNVERFAPNEADRVILAMPIGLCRAALAVESAELARAASAMSVLPAQSPSTVLSMRVDELELSVSAFNLLQELEIETVADLVALTEQELVRAIEKRAPKQKPASKILSAKEQRRRILNAIKDVLADHSLSLRAE